MRHMHIACWITKATNTNSEYVIFIAFPLQQWSGECVSMLRYTYTACLYVVRRQEIHAIQGYLSVMILILTTFHLSS